MIQINNAGCMVNERKVDADGLEANFATNCLGLRMKFSYFSKFYKRKKRKVFKNKNFLMKVKL